MKEEEIIRKLEDMDLPEIEVDGYRRQLRAALLQSGHFREERKTGIIDSARSKITGVLVARRPIWQASLVSALLVAIIFSLSLVVPSALRQTSSATQLEWLDFIRDLEARGVFHTSLAFDNKDNPAISYWDKSTHLLEVAQWDGASWDTETVDAGSGGCLAFDPSGNPVIAYRAYLADILKYAFQEGSTWIIQTVDFGQVQDISLGFETTGNPVISYSDVSTGNVKTARWNGASWEVQES